MKRFLYFIFDLVCTVFAAVGVVFSGLWAIVILVRIYNIGYLLEEDKTVALLCLCILGMWGFMHRKTYKDFLLRNKS